MTKPSPTPRRVIVETPFAGKGANPEAAAQDHELNVRYARACLLDSLRRGEAPFASHLIYTQVLRDSVPEDRELGISAGLAWVSAADATVVYEDFGHSSGMKLGIAAAEEAGRTVEYRRLYAEGMSKRSALGGQDDSFGYLR